MRRVTVIDPVRVLLAAWRLLILGAVIGAVVVAGIAKSLPKTYKSFVTIQVQSDTNGNPDADARQLGTDEAVATSDSVVNAVGQQLGIDPATVRASLGTVTADEGDVFSITATSSSPTSAQQIAQTTGKVFITQHTQQVDNVLKGEIAQATALLQSDTARLPTTTSAVAQQTLQTQIVNDSSSLETLQNQLASGQADVSILNQARKGLASSPGAATSGILGLLLGLIAAGALALLRATRGERLTTTTGILSATGLPLLAQVPFSRQLTGVPGRYDMHPLEADGVADAVRGLEVALRADRSGNRMVLVASAGRFDGKTTVAAQLAAASAASGLQTILVVADTRAPAQLSGVDDEAPGLTDVLLRSGAQITDVMFEVEVDNKVVPGLLVVPLGRHARQGSDLLRGPRTRDVMAELATLADVVVIDGPALSVPEGLALAGAVGEMVLCIGTHDARRSVLIQTLDSVSAAGGTTLGAVIVDVEDRLRPEHSDYDLEAAAASTTTASPAKAPARKLQAADPAARVQPHTLPERRDDLPSRPALEAGDTDQPVIAAEADAASQPAADVPVIQASPTEVAPAEAEDPTGGAPGDRAPAHIDPPGSDTPTDPTPEADPTPVTAAIEAPEAADPVAPSVLHEPGLITFEATPVPAATDPASFAVPALVSATPAMNEIDPGVATAELGDAQTFQALAAHFVKKFDPDAYAALSQDEDWVEPGPAYVPAEAESAAPHEPARAEAGQSPDTQPESAQAEPPVVPTTRTRQRRRVNRAESAPAELADAGDPAAFPFEKYAEADSWFRA